MGSPITSATSLSLLLWLMKISDTLVPATTRAAHPGLAAASGGHRFHGAQVQSATIISNRVPAPSMPRGTKAPIPSTTTPGKACWGTIWRLDLSARHTRSERARGNAATSNTRVDHAYAGAAAIESRGIGWIENPAMNHGGEYIEPERDLAHQIVVALDVVEATALHPPSKLASQLLKITIQVLMPTLPADAENPVTFGGVTMAGNFIVLGSIANLIVVQCEAANGIVIGFLGLIQGRSAGDASHPGAGAAVAMAVFDPAVALPTQPDSRFNRTSLDALNLVADVRGALGH
jgi:hypothetical protein